MKSSVCILLLLLGIGHCSVLRTESVVVYYELSSSTLTYNRLQAVVERGPKLEALKQIKEPHELVEWMAFNAFAITEHQVYPSMDKMLEAQELEERDGKKKTTLTLSVGFSRKLQRDSRRNYKLGRQKKALGLLGAFSTLAGVQLTIVTFAIWFVKDLQKHHLAILYGREEARLHDKLEPSKQEASFIQSLVESQKYSKDLFNAVQLENSTFWSKHSAQIKKVSGRNKAIQQKAKQTSAASSSPRLTYVFDASTGQGRFVSTSASASGNEPPTRPPRVTPKPTPTPLLVDRDDNEIEVIDDDDIRVIEEDVQVIEDDVIPLEVGKKRKRPDLADPFPAPGPSRPRLENLDDSLTSKSSKSSTLNVLDTSEEELANANLPEWTRLKLTKEEYDNALLLASSEPETLQLDADFRVTTFDAPARVQRCGLLPDPENVADARASHQQQCVEGRISSSVAVPATVLAAHERRVGYHLTRPRLPARQISRPRGETESEWRGLSWHTPAVTNGCNIDSFLTYVLLRSNLQPQFARRYFLIPRNVAEGALALAIRDYTQAGESQDARMDMNSKIKSAWAVANFWNYRNEFETTGRTDVLGGEDNNIGIPMRDSSVLLRSTFCQCQDADGSNELHTENVQSLDKAWTPEQIRNLFQTGETPSPNRCKLCKSARAFRSLYVPDTTWYLRFDVLVQERALNQFPVSTLPETLSINELSQPDSQATFELGYISLTNRQPNTAQRSMITHQTSLMRFGDQWWYFDDMVRDGRLLLVDDPDQIIKKFGLSITAVSYFRK